MARNNDVFQVLVTKGGLAPAALNTKITALGVGQIGVFDFDTNLALSAASTSRNFYLAVGLDTNGDTVLDDVAKSTGSHIQGKNIAFYSFRPHTPGRPMKVVLSDYTANCETEYGIKLEMRNQEIYRTQGYNQFTHTYMIKTACCSGCTPTCPSGDANEITRLLKLNINNDPNGLVTAIAIARTALVKADIDAVTTGVFSADIAEGAEVSDADLLVLMEYNSLQTDVADYLYTDLEITTVTQKINNFCSVNLNYFYPRETVVIASKIEGFKCTGTLETTQTATFEEGSGYDVKQKEYMALGWTESPYRLSTLNGVAEERTFNAVSTTKYDQIALTYDQASIGAWEQFLANEATIVAIPAADKVATLQPLVTILDALLLGKVTPLSAAAAAAVITETTQEPTSGKTVTTDGLSI